jgi:hypothetical protein
MKTKSDDKTNGRSQDAMNARVSKTRREIAALALSLNELAEWRLSNLSVDGSDWHDGPGNGGERHGGWASFRQRLDAARARGGKVADGVAHEIERHPLIGGLAAFGLGFGVAMLLFRKSRAI